jgi:hypothetical protein
MVQPRQLHEWVERYNWDDGLAPIWVIADWPRTELATALLIYWRLGGPALQAGPGSVNWPAQQLQDLVRDRILAGYYPKGGLRYDPELSRVQLYQYWKAAVPEALLTPDWDA